MLTKDKQKTKEGLEFNSRQLEITNQVGIFSKLKGATMYHMYTLYFFAKPLMFKQKFKLYWIVCKL